MRKYRNIKGNLQPKRILKYSEEWIQYRKSRGADSVKTEHCDIDTDGHLDAIVRAWRSPALKKLQICQSVPTGGPTNVRVNEAEPQTGPTGLQAALLAPQNGPSNVTVVENVPPPTTGPTALSSVALTVPATGPTALTSQALAPSTGPTGLTTGVIPSTGPTVLTSQIALAPIATKIYIRPEVRALPFSGNRSAQGTDLAAVYTNFNFSPGATTGTACNTYGVYGCYAVYNQKNGFATNTPGTFHLGGLYELSTPVTSTNPFYTRTHKLDLINNVYIADPDNSKPTLVRSNNASTGWTDMWQLRWDNQPEAKFNFGGVFDWTLLPTPDEAWHMRENGTTGSINKGDIDLTNLVNAWFEPYSNTVGFNGTYRLTHAYKT